LNPFNGIERVPLPLSVISCSLSLNPFNGIERHQALDKEGGRGQGAENPFNGIERRAGSSSR
jgi:hypothetical protein